VGVGVGCGSVPGFGPPGLVGVAVGCGVGVAVGSGVMVGSGVVIGVSVGLGSDTAALGPGLGAPAAMLPGRALANGAWVGALLPVGVARAPEVGTVLACLLAPEPLEWLLVLPLPV
jgi:hypothetical protein